MPRPDTLTINLYASEIGSILGKNPFCSRIEVIKRVWYQIEGQDTPETCRPRPDLLKRVGQTMPGQQLKKKKYNMEDHKRFNDIVTGLEKDLTQRGHAELKSSAQGLVRTEMGKNSEDLVMEIASNHPDIGKCRSAQERFSKLAWKSNDGKVEVVISGRIDCRDEQGRLVEIKTRVGRKPYVRATEFVQLQTYLFLASAHSGYIIELYKDEKDDENKIFVNKPLTFDDDWWKEEVVPAFISFADDLATSIKARSLVILDAIKEEDENFEKEFLNYTNNKEKIRQSSSTV